jgi:effector-binding domain-containing protein
MNREIVLADVQPRPLAAVRTATRLSDWPSQFMTPLNKVYDAVRAGKVRQSDQNVMVYRPRGDGLFDIECGVEVAAKFEKLGEVEYCETPGGAALTTVHVGPYGRLRASHGAVLEWSSKNGYGVSGICWEIYGDWDDDPAKLRNEIFHLLIR